MKLKIEDTETNNTWILDIETSDFAILQTSQLMHKANIYLLF